MLPNNLHHLLAASSDAHGHSSGESLLRVHEAVTLMRFERIRGASVRARVHHGGDLESYGTSQYLKNQITAKGVAFASLAQNGSDVPQNMIFTK